VTAIINGLFIRSIEVPMKVCIACLAWKKLDLFERTLETYKQTKLLDYIDEKIVFFQEINDKGMDLARKYRFKPMGATSNVGIGRAFASLAQESNAEFIIFCEEDFQCIAPVEAIIEQLVGSQYLLETKTADVVKLRNRKYPGKPMYTHMHYLNNNKALIPTHLLDSVHWLSDDELPPELSIVYANGTPFVATTAEHANYTNNPCIFYRKWFLKNVGPFCSGSGVALEGEIQPWWEKQKDIKVCQGEGLFWHYSP
jgi:hypothetical protein